MRRYPGRSGRLFEAPPPDLTPRRVRPPDGSLLAPAYGRARFVDAYEVGVASWSVVGIEAVAWAFAGAVPPAVGYIARPRDLVLKLTGHPQPWWSAPPPGDRAELAAGDTAGIFRVTALKPDEVVLTPGWRLLEVRVSLRFGNDTQRRWLTVTTVARPARRLGDVLLGPFAALHRWVMPEVAGEVARRIDTPKPAPPWRHLYPQA